MEMILIVILIAIVVLLAVIASRERSPRPMRRTPRGLDPAVEAEIERRRVSEEADRAIRRYPSPLFWVVVIIMGLIWLSSLHPGVGP
jgi:hypothetical protein